jgi:hypothetical protein
MLLTEDGDKFVEHFQWMDRAAYEAYRASDLGKAAASLPVTLTRRSSSCASWR